MMRRNTLLSLIAVACCAGLASADVPRKAQVVAPEMSRPDTIQLTQQFSPKCATAYGVCWVPPQPLDSVCYCGPDQGVIVP